ncbi:Shedu anti-phage system protein SduA domain-containing protein [Sphaerisporangium sp. NPDC049002]|uniref:Shedu anti-phage system protein SduA domain-containing protein n=1 Tax=Sphaerisporangium sp. NPDC049002 TaxID=3155392 RepID=UPI0033D0A0D3
MRIDFPFYASKEFVIEGGDFSQLEIRPSGQDSFHYFYDKARRRLVTDFVLHDGARVATLCTVTLIYKDGTYKPRLRFWKKDKTKTANQPYLDIEIPDVPETRMVRAAVDTSEAHQNLWVLIEFLQKCREISLPADQFKVVGNDSARIANLLQASNKSQIIEALRSVLGGSLTQAELDIIANRKGQLQVFHKYLTDSSYFEQRRKQLKEAEKDSGPEAVWEDFFESNPWIFGYGLSLISCTSYDDQKLQQITTGASKFGGGGKRTDGLLRTRGIVSSLLFCEIKRHDTSLLMAKHGINPFMCDRISAFSVFMVLI